ncbi:hypothetical protein VNO78_01714 [Psophocarpus tetragonolobus]|uniref:Uncharacterized protein n=1 Tax=Psophocarpus tetragonolobus TaxID=3891 RepID=A0AAN9T0P0_PSOTE
MMVNQNAITKLTIGKKNLRYQHATRSLTLSPLFIVSDILALNSLTFFDPLRVSLHEIRTRLKLLWVLCFLEFNSGLGFMGWLARLALGVKFSSLGF